MDFLQNYRDLKQYTENINNITDIEELEHKLFVARNMLIDLDNLKQVFKANNNSLYGSMGNKYFEFMDIDVAEDITGMCRHFAIIVDRGINKMFANWANDENIDETLRILKQHLPDIKSVINLDYVEGVEGKDVCIYGDTDSRMVDLDDILSLCIRQDGSRYPLPENNEDIIKFGIFINDNFIQNAIADSIKSELHYINGKEGYLKMGLESIAKKSVFHAKKMYIMSLIFNDGKHLKEIELKKRGVSLKRGETSSQMKKLIEKIVKKYMNGDISKNDIPAETNKVVSYLRKLRNKSVVARNTSVKNVSKLVKTTEVINGLEKTVYNTGSSNDIGSQLIRNWANFIEENGLQSHYKLVFAGQKMKYYKTTSEKYPVFGSPDDVDLETIPNAPEPDWKTMINQQFVKPLLKYIMGVEEPTDNDCDILAGGIQVSKLSF